MMEPFFFDCLTDAQCWSLFNMGVLQGYMVPLEVYERLARIAPDHGCYLFTWPAGAELPALPDILPGLAALGEEAPVQPHSHGLETRLTIEEMRLAIEAFGARLHTHRLPEGRRIHIMTTTPRPELRAGPYLEPQPHDLSAMSLPELQAYLDEVLRVDEDGNVDAPVSPASR